MAQRFAAALSSRGACNKKAHQRYARINRHCKMTAGRLIISLTPPAEPRYGDSAADCTDLSASRYALARRPAASYRRLPAILRAERLRQTIRQHLCPVADSLHAAVQLRYFHTILPTHPASGRGFSFATRYPPSSSNTRQSRPDKGMPVLNRLLPKASRTSRQQINR